MSMTISGANYASSVYQNTKISDTEKQEKKEGMEKGEKTRQSSTSASMDRVDLGETGIAISDVSRMQGAEQTNQEKTGEQLCCAVLPLLL